MSCGRVITWRKKWQDCWDEVKYCSSACRGKKPAKQDRLLEEAILEALQGRSQNATICPSEVAQSFFGEDLWRDKMEQTRCAARRLVACGKLEILQNAVVVDPSTAKGPIRLRLK